MAELVYAHDLKSCPERDVGSSPTRGTNIKLSDFCPTDSAALGAAEFVGKMPESQILVELYNYARTHFERNA